MTYQYIRLFDEIGIDDIPLVGGKNASLGEMYQNLASSRCIKIPNGFAITAQAYRYILDESHSWEDFTQQRWQISTRLMLSNWLTSGRQRAREIIYAAGMPR